MYKVELKFDFVSPFMNVMTGTVQIGQIDFGRLSDNEFPPFPFKKEKHSLGYQNCPAIFSRTKPIIDIMLHSYFDGMLLRKESVEWFRNSHRHDHDVTVVFAD